MFCENCGHEMPDDSVFCTVCGSRVSQESIEEPKKEESQAEEERTDSLESQPREDVPKKKIKKEKKKKLVIAGVAGGTVLTAGIVGFAAKDQIQNWYLKSFASPEEYMAHVLEENTDQLIKNLANSYGAYIDLLQGENGQGSIGLELEAGDEISALLSMVDPSLADLKKISLDVDYLTQKDQAGVQLGLGINGADILHMNVLSDQSNEKIYMQIPEWSDLYLGVALDYMDAEFSKEDLEVLETVLEKMPSEEVLERLLTTYTGVLYDSLDQVTKTEKTISAQGVSQKYTALTASIDGKYAYDVQVALIQQLKKDQDIQKLCKEYGELMGVSDLSDQLDQELDALLSDLQEEKEFYLQTGTVADITVLVDSQGDIAGVECEILETGAAINYHMPVSGSQFGYEFTIEADGMDYMSLTGKGTIKSDKLNGTFDFSVDDSLLDGAQMSAVLFTVEVKNYDLKKAKEGNLNGSFEITSDAVSELQNAALELNFQGSGKESSVSGVIKYGAQEIFTVRLTSGKGSDVHQIDIPDDSKVIDAADESALYSYVQDIDLEAYLKEVLEKTGLELDYEYYLYGLGDSYDDSDDDFYSDYYYYDEEYYSDDYDDDYYLDYYSDYVF